MGFQCGIVGLPNVGKSTLFNAVTQAGAEAANYPFCTIDPNVGVAAVRDPRLDEIAKIFKPEKVISTTVEFVDIAGLVQGASKGEGLGNQFLGHIKSVQAIVHVVRCFEDENITHVAGSVDPLRDIAIIDTELMLADLASVQKRFEKTARLAKVGAAQAQAEQALLKRLEQSLNDGIPVRKMAISEEEMGLLNELALLTAKPVLYVANVAEADLKKPSSLVEKVEAYAKSEQSACVVLSGAIEAEIAALDPLEQQEFLKELGLSETGLDRLARAGHKLLKLISFFTAGQKEVRAWTIPENTKAPQAAGVIHSDFEKGFIKAEIYHYDDLIACGSEALVREKGLMRLEGKDYVVKDGDIIYFRFNV